MPGLDSIRRHGAAALGALALASAPALAQAEFVEVELRTAEGEEAGTATFRQALHGVLISLDLRNLTPGPHGLHIHETGACSPDFMAAGGHYDPLGAEHGFDSEGGYHVGDLPNIVAAPGGTVRGDVFAPQVTLSGPYNGRYPFTLRDHDGSALMIHAGGDNYRDMASSGGRVACGVIAPARG